MTKEQILSLKEEIAEFVKSASSNGLLDEAANLSDGVEEAMAIGLCVGPIALSVRCGIERERFYELLTAFWPRVERTFVKESMT